MGSISYVYLLRFYNQPFFKIGKADSINNRMQSFIPQWGAVDRDNSRYIKTDADSVFKLERSLQFMLSSYSLTGIEGDGCTELFTLDAWDDAVSYAEIFCRSDSCAELIEGIEESKQESIKVDKTYLSSIEPHLESRAIRLLDAIKNTYRNACFYNDNGEEVGFLVKTDDFKSFDRVCEVLDKFARIVYLLGVCPSKCPLSYWASFSEGVGKVQIDIKHLSQQQEMAA